MFCCVVHVFVVGLYAVFVYALCGWTNYRQANEHRKLPVYSKESYIKMIPMTCTIYFDYYLKIQ